MQPAKQFKVPEHPLSLDTVMALQLIGLFRDSNRDIDEIVDFISRHPAMVRETIKRCNRLTFHGAERTTDIFEAVSRLGFYEVYGIVTQSLAAQGIDINAVQHMVDEEQWDDLGALPPARGFPN
jgi:HD-like signal output (HDOD) protein